MRLSRIVNPLASIALAWCFSGTALATSQGVEGAPAVSASENGAPIASHAQEQARSDWSQLRRRVLRLHNGAVVRDLTRYDQDQWWIGPRSRAQALPAHLVTSALEEKALLKEHARRSKAQPHASAALAAWGFEVGLLKEGLAALDDALSSHQQRSAGLRVLELQRRYLPKPPSWQSDDDPQTLWDRQWLWLQARHTLTMERLAAQTWAEAAPADDRSRTQESFDAWMAPLTQASANGSPAQRQFALHALTLWRGDRSAPDLQRFALLDASERVRRQAGWLLGTLDNAQHVRPIIGLVDHDQMEVRVRATQALGQAGYAAAVPALVASLQSGGSAHRVPHAHVFFGKQTAYVQDFDVEVASASAVADPIVNVLPSGVVLDAGVRSVTIERHLIEVRRSLQQITGHRPGASARSWNRWLERFPTVDAAWRAPWPTPDSL